MRRVKRCIKPLATMIVGSFAVLAVSHAPSAAARCIDEVEQLADVYGLSADPPVAPTNDTIDPVSPRELERSGGVIEPPATGDPAVIEPPETGGTMETVPDVTPPREEEQPRLSPADLSVLETMLISARAEAERGQEEDCFERVQKAQAFIERETQ